MNKNQSWEEEEAELYNSGERVWGSISDWKLEQLRADKARVKKAINKMIEETNSTPSLCGDTRRGTLVELKERLGLGDKQ